MNARPMYLRRIEFHETCTEMDSEIGPDASRTFGPSPKPRMDVYVLRAIALYCVCFWAAILGAAVTLWPK